MIESKIDILFDISGIMYLNCNDVIHYRIYNEKLR